MTKEYGERQIGPALMIDAGKAAMRDDVERLFATVIGMGAPADIGEKTRCMPQPALLGGLIESGSGHESVGPGDQFLAMARRAGAQLIEMPRRFEQCVFFLFFFLEQRQQ